MSKQRSAPMSDFSTSAFTRASRSRRSRSKSIRCSQSTPIEPNVLIATSPSRSSTTNHEIHETTKQNLLTLVSRVFAFSCFRGFVVSCFRVFVFSCFCVFVFLCACCRLSPAQLPRRVEHRALGWDGCIFERGRERNR